MRRAAARLAAALTLLVATYTSADASEWRRHVPQLERHHRVQNPAEYSEVEALQFAHFSHAAYCNASGGLKNWTCGPCQLADPHFQLAGVYENKTSGMQVYTGASTGRIIIGFRGTNNLPNWIENLKFGQLSEYPKCDGCRVHDGFYKTWIGVSDEVLSDVRRLLQYQPEAKIYITGHSLGAAVGVLCATELFSLGKPVEAVYTYGLPRVGNKAFAAFYTGGVHISWRLTHWRDPVPHLPPAVAGFFRHTSTEVFYPEHFNSFKVCDDSGEDPTCSNSLWYTTSVDDHLNYLNISISVHC